MCEEQTISLVDVLEEDEELEEEASAVLAGSDSDLCSYPQGYVKRQALYACNTCTSKGGEAAGVCLACSYKCHEGHDLYELYTKRNFRCDCGNRKFSGMQCKLYHEKDDTNSQNKYNHNFFGVYCTCRRPYPDPDDQVEDEMIQCVVCEDWLHGRHLGCVVPDCVELQEMICESCMNKNPFLWTYAAHLAVSGTEVPMEEDREVSGSNVPKKEEKVDDVVEPRCKRNREEVETSCRQEGPQVVHQKRDQSGAEEAEPGCRMKELQTMPQKRDQSGAEEAEPGCRMKELQTMPQKRDQSGAEEAEPGCRMKELQTMPQKRDQSGAEEAEPGCRMKELQTMPQKRDQSGAEEAEPSCRLIELLAMPQKRDQTGAVFWPSAWRSKLCACNTCQVQLSAAGLSFLLDELDTVLAYENKGKSNEQRQQGHDPLMSALDNLNRVQQLEIIHGYNDMKTELKDFLQTFAAEGKVVTSDDIRQFFEQQSRKRRRVDAGPFYCS